MLDREESGEYSIDIEDREGVESKDNKFSRGLDGRRNFGSSKIKEVEK